MKNYAWLSLSLGLLACQPPASTEAEEKKWNLKLVESPASLHSGEPNLFVSAEGKVYQSWIEELENDMHALKFSSWEDEQWSSPMTIAQDTSWFVNWADFPSVAVTPNFMAAHWLVKSTEGTYDYDIKVAISEDQGKNWTEPFTLHRDSMAAEHGFVTMLPAEEEMFAVWLDGRFTKGHNHEENQTAAGAMTLHTTTFNQWGEMGQEVELDHRICDCCQTDAVITDQGPIVIYRNRTEEEVRDIYITRQLEGEWTTPEAVFADEWQINACPVNGPAIAAEGQNLAVAWFTGAQNTAKVQLAFSEDYGASFRKPIQIDHGNPLGRVDVIMLDHGQALVSWLEALNEGAEIRAALINREGKVLVDQQIANTASSRSSGFPIMEKAGEQAFFSWTHVEEQNSQIMTALLDLNEMLP